jgi:hypothetical protein
MARTRGSVGVALSIGHAEPRRVRGAWYDAHLTQSISYIYIYDTVIRDTPLVRQPDHPDALNRPSAR